jgi:hypothetical protein
MAGPPRTARRVRPKDGPSISLAKSPQISTEPPCGAFFLSGGERRCSRTLRLTPGVPPCALQAIAFGDVRSGILPAPQKTRWSAFRGDAPGEIGERHRGGTRSHNRATARRPLWKPAPTDRLSAGRSGAMLLARLAKGIAAELASTIERPHGGRSGNPRQRIGSLRGVPARCSWRDWRKASRRNSLPQSSDRTEAALETRTNGSALCGRAFRRDVPGEIVERHRGGTRFHNRATARRPPWKPAPTNRLSVGGRSRPML